MKIWRQDNYAKPGFFESGILLPYLSPPTFSDYQNMIPAFNPDKAMDFNPPSLSITIANS